MIEFKKNGRPTKKEKELVKNINRLYDSFDDEKRVSFDIENEIVRSPERLNEIWESLNNLESRSEAINVDKETGEILENDDLFEKKDTHEPNYEYEQDFERDEFFDVDDSLPINEKEQNGTKENTEANKVNNKVNENNMSDKTEDAVFEEVLDTKEEEVPDFFSPLSEPVKERSYNKSSGEGYVGNIDEPDFDNSPMQEEDYEEEEESSGYDDDSDEPKGFDNVRNEQMESLDEKDRKLAAKQLVDSVLSGYEMLHVFAQNLVKVPEEKIQEKIANGEIDPNLRIPIDERGTEVSPQAFFEGYNEQAEQALSYDEEFGERVRPAMEREFSKRGWGVTDLQYIGIEVLKDAGMKAIQAFQLRKTANHILHTFATVSRENNIAQAKAQSQAVNPDSITTPPRPEPNPVQQQPHDEGDLEDIEE